MVFILLLTLPKFLLYFLYLDLVKLNDVVLEPFVLGVNRDMIGQKTPDGEVFALRIQLILKTKVRILELPETWI